MKLPSPARERIERVVRAIVEAEIAEELGREDLLGVPFVQETAEVLARRLFGMQRFLAGGLSAMTLLFDGSTVATDGARFHQLPLHARRRALARVRTVPVGLVHNFCAFYDKMGVFIFWSHVEENRQLDRVL